MTKNGITQKDTHADPLVVVDSFFLRPFFISDSVERESSSSFGVVAIVFDCCVRSNYWVLLLFTILSGQWHVCRRHLSIRVIFDVKHAFLDSFSVVLRLLCSSPSFFTFVYCDVFYYCYCCYCVTVLFGSFVLGSICACSGITWQVLT